MSTTQAPSAALTAYESFASYYDAFTWHHDYEDWTTTLEGLAKEHGLRGRRLLDVGCGTGKSFLPFLERGYQVTACELSPRMLALAQRKAANRARIVECDMRALPQLGEFDLVLALDDVVNYLTEPDDLSRAFGGIAANLAPDGLFLFDANSLSSFRTFFAESFELEQAGRRMRFEGHGDPDFAPGGLADVAMTAEEGSSPSRHRQRHHSVRAVVEALGAAGLRCIDIYGQMIDGRVEQPADELIHTKTIFVARR